MKLRLEEATVIFPVLGFRRSARLLVLVFLSVGIALAWHWRAVIDPLEISAAISRYPAAPVAFLAVHIVASLLFVPRTVLAIAAGILFGIAWGIVWAEVGSVAGATGGFLLARYLDAGSIGTGRSERLGQILRQVECGGWRAVALLRLIPALPHSLGNYGLALTRMPLGAYAFGSLVGQLPMTIACVELGGAGERWFTGRASWIEPTLIGLALLALSLLIPTFSRPWRQRLRCRAAGGPVEEFDRVHDRNDTVGGKLCNTSDVAGRDNIGLDQRDVGELPLAQRRRDFRL
jgi:uncharacterized membrane protein YdjX (TVP38/TMEM64 family)